MNNILPGWIDSLPATEERRATATNQEVARSSRALLLTPRCEIARAVQISNDDHSFWAHRSVGPPIGTGSYNPSRLALSPGSHVGPYRVLAAIGAGGMGEVYRARDTKLGREVAIKVLPEPFATDPERVARFRA